MDNARQAAAAGFMRPESIPLLALTDESFYHGKLSWTLRFPVPPPDISGSVRRFSSTVTFRQGPHSAEALDGALRLATSFPITMTPLMFSSTPLSYVSLISLSSALRVLTPMNLRHLRNMRYKSGLTIVRRGLPFSLPRISSCPSWAC